MDVDCHVAFLVQLDSFFEVDSSLEVIALGDEDASTEPEFAKGSAEDFLDVDLVVIAEGLLEVVSHLSSLCLVVPEYARDTPQKLNSELNIELPFANVVSQLSDNTIKISSLSNFF